MKVGAHPQVTDDGGFIDLSGQLTGDDRKYGFEEASKVKKCVMQLIKVLEGS